MFKSKKFKIFLLILVITASAYGLGRIYFHVTDGFTMENITSDFPYDPRWEIRPLNPQEQVVVDNVLNQKFKYLGKGCQSYVFESEDGNYVIKFFKYQRFRNKFLIDTFTFIPAVNRYRDIRAAKKQRKLEGVFSSWKIAFEDLKPETGLVFVHLNKSSNLQKTILFTDKTGIEHSVNADEVEFLVQRKAKMLCPTIDAHMANNDIQGAQELLLKLLGTILSEYNRGYADNDHALMQNTGVMDGTPVHIDVGQFVKNPEVMQPIVYKQELFTKTYKFRIWLKEHHPELATFLEGQLREIIGASFDTMKPIYPNK